MDTFSCKDSISLNPLFWEYFIQFYFYIHVFKIILNGVQERHNKKNEDLFQIINLRKVVISLFCIFKCFFFVAYVYCFLNWYVLKLSYPKVLIKVNLVFFFSLCSSFTKKFNVTYKTWSVPGRNSCPYLFFIYLMSFIELFSSSFYFY